MTPFCDFASVTSPWDQRGDVLAALHPVLDGAGFALTEYDADRWLWRPPVDGGSVLIKRAHRVLVVGTSGGALRHLRGVGLLADYLFALGGGPHRVTFVDVTRDTPTPAPAVVRDVIRRAQLGLIQPSRKRIAPNQVKYYLSLDAWGNETGTVYVGPPGAMVRPKVYDKRWQQYELTGVDIGPCTRTEVRVQSRLGITLRDVFDASALFYHVASPDLLAAPDGVHAWTPYTDGGFTLRPPFKLEPYDLMLRLLDASPDVKRMLQYAHAAGPHALDLLCQRLRAMADAAPISGGGIACAAERSKQPPAEVASATVRPRSH